MAFANIPGAPYSVRYYDDRRYTGEQRPPHPLRKSLINTGIFGGSILGLHYLGSTTFGSKRGYDYFVKGIKHLEEYTPINLFRTFQLGSFFSQFTTEAAATRFFSPEQFINDRTLRTYTNALIGGDVATSIRLMTEGATFRGGRLYWGLGEDVALKYAAIVINPLADEAGSPMARWSAAYARSLGVDDFSRLWKGQKFERYFGSGEGIQLIGAQNRFSHIGRQIGAWGTEGVGRFNRLLLDPAELPIASDIFKLFRRGVAKATGGRITMPFGLGVRPSGALSMLGRLSLKWGAIGTLGWLAYKEIDRRTRQSSLLEGTLLEEGTTVAAASLWAKANIGVSGIAETLGLHKYREWQEGTYPGSTQLSRLLGFPIAGALVGATAMYGRRLFETARRQVKGVPLSQAGKEAAEVVGKFGEGPFGKLGKWLTSKGIFSKLSPMKLAALAGAGVGLALVAPFLPGALVPSTRPEELRKIYSGEQEVPVRKGRWWPLGRSQWEGSNIQYYSPHPVARMRWRAKEKALWGEEADTLSEFEKYRRKEFTYELEEKQPYGYAAPISSLPFEDIPLIGPILANTIGRLIKPPRLLRTEEWLKREPGGETTYKPEGLRYGEEFAPELGEIPRGAPESPYGLKQAFREQLYRGTEMVGLPGFISTAIKEKLTGTQDYFSDIQELESFRRAHGIERGYWEEEVGDPLGFTEGFRRLFPHRIRSVPLYNPLSSGAPSWLPGAGERSPNFQEGMMYAKVPLGEVRLPGPGYAERYPELKGVAPEEYPDIFKYTILADVAPYSEKFDEVAARIRAERKSKEWNERYEGLYQKSQQQLAARKIRKTFYDYEYLKPYGEPGEGSTTEARVLAAMNEANAAGIKPQTIIGKLFGGYWEWLTHSAETSLEQITPLAPINKFVHMRDAIEDYKRSQLYSDDYAFWQTPVESFIKPFAYSTAAHFGYEGIPSGVEEKRDIESYFDVLKFMKYHRLALRAEEAGDMEGVKEYSGKRAETLFGLNPYTRHIGNIYRALPRSERDYFQDFVAARTQEEKSKILKMVPENQKALYTAQWQMAYADEARKGVQSGQISGELADEAMRQVAEIDRQRSEQGFPKSQELFGEYLQTRLKGESYSDWYRRTKLLASALEGKYIPGPDFVGWNPAVDLNDVKLKYVQNEGMDSHDFNIWDDQVRSLEYKPYITPELVQQMDRHYSYSESDIHSRIDSIFGGRRMRGGYTVSTQASPLGKNTATINVVHDRRKELRRRMREGLNG